METQQTQQNTDGHTRNTNPGGNPKGRVRARGWTFTINTYDTEDFETIKKWPGRIIVFQTEVGASGTPHIQGGIYFKNPRNFSAVKKLHGRAHWEKMRNLNATVTYCTKEDTWDGNQRYYRKDEKVILNNNTGATKLVKKEHILDDLKKSILKDLKEDWNANKWQWIHDLGITNLHREMGSKMW